MRPSFPPNKKNLLDGFVAHPLTLRIGVDPLGNARSAAHSELATRFQRHTCGRLIMKLMGFLLLLAGWGLVVSAIAMLPSPTARASFVLAGVGVELGGLALVVRSHYVVTIKKP